MVFIGSRCHLARLGLVALPLLLAGCPDPEAELEQFNERYALLHPPVDAGSCASQPCQAPAVGEIDGDFLWSVSAELGRDQPVLWRASLTTAAGTTGLEFSYSAVPLSAADRSTEVGSAVDYGPYAVDPATGCYAGAVALVAPGAANPINGLDLTADVTMEGKLCTAVDFLCGTMTGQLTAPVEYALTSSTYTFEAVPTPGVYPAPPKINCAGDLARPL
jgi:hypothetical protein